MWRWILHISHTFLSLHYLRTNPNNHSELLTYMKSLNYFYLKERGSFETGQYDCWCANNYVTISALRHYCTFFPPTLPAVQRKCIWFLFSSISMSDFLVSDEMGRIQVAIDLIGPVNFCANFPARPLVQLVLKERHLKGMGYKFCWVRTFELVCLE